MTLELYCSEEDSSGQVTGNSRSWPLSLKFVCVGEAATAQITLSHCRSVLLSARTWAFDVSLQTLFKLAWACRVWQDPAGSSVLPSDWRGETRQAPRGGLRVINSFLDVLYVSAQRPQHGARGESRKTKELFGTGCSFWHSEKQIAITAGVSSSDAASVCSW